MILFQIKQLNWFEILFLRMFQSQVVGGFMVELLLRKVDRQKEELDSLIQQNIQLWCQDLYSLPFQEHGICGDDHHDQRRENQDFQPGSPSPYTLKLKQKLTSLEETQRLAKQKINKDIRREDASLQHQKQKKNGIKIEEKLENINKQKKFEKLEETKRLQNSVCSKVKKNLRFQAESNQDEQILRDIKYGNKLRFSRMSSKKSLYSHEGKDHRQHLRLAYNPIKLEYKVSQQKVIKSKSLKEPPVRPANIIKKQQDLKKQEKKENKVKYRIQLQSQKNKVLVLKNSSKCLSKLYLMKKSNDGVEKKERSNKAKSSYIKEDKQNKDSISKAGQLKLIRNQPKHKVYIEEDKKKNKKLFVFEKENKNLILVHNHQKLIDILSNQQKNDSFYHSNYKFNISQKS